MYIPEHEQQCAFGHRHRCQDAHRLLCANTSEQHVQLHFDSAWTAVRALDQTWTCVQGTVQVGSGVRELLTLLRSEKQWYVQVGDVNTDWGDMESVDGRTTGADMKCVDGSTTEAQLHSTTTISIVLWSGEDNADRLAARVRWLRLLRHLPHLKSLSITVRGDIMGDQEAAALTDALQHRKLQVQSCARVSQTVRAHLHAAAPSHCNILLLRGLQRWCKLLLAGNCGV